MINLWTRLLQRLAAREVCFVRRSSGRGRRRPARSALSTQVLEARALLSASVLTDLQDYSPGTTAEIRAWNSAEADATDFDWAQAIQFQVIRTDGIGDLPNGNLPWFVTDGVAGFDGHYVDSNDDGTPDYGVFPDTDGAADGEIGTTWFVEDQYAGSSLRLIASQAANDDTGFAGAEATHDFTDSVTLLVTSPSSSNKATVTVGGQFSIGYTITTNSASVPTGQTGYNYTISATIDKNFGGTPVSYSLGSSTISETNYLTNSVRTWTANVPSNAQSANGWRLTLSVTQLYSGGGQAAAITSQVSNSVDVTAASATSTTVSASTATYGSNATFSATVSGNPSVGTMQFYVGTSIATGTPIGSPVSVTSGTATLTTNPGLSVGNSTIWAVYSGGTGFQSSNGSATLIVTPRAVAISADPKSVTYGDADPALTYQITSGTVVAGDSFTGALTRASGNNVGTYAITQGTLSLGSNYNLSYIGADLTITPAALNITANSASKTYDGQAYSGGNGVTYFGFVNGETSAALGGALTYSGNSQGATNVGTYTITPGGLTSGNYNIGFSNGSLTIGQRSVSVKADAQSKTYADANPSLTATVTNVPVGAAALNYTLATTATQFSDVGTYPIAITLGSNPNYNVTETDDTLTINQRSVSVAADAKSKTYANANPTLSATETNVPVGAAALNYTLATTATQFSDVGTYAIAVTLGSNPNYNVTANSGSLTISQRLVNVTADAQSKTYADANPSLTATVTNVPVGAAALNYTLATTATQFSDVGTYAIAITLGSNPNYIVTANNGSLTINQRTLTVTANASSKTYDSTTTASATLSDDRVNSDDITVNQTLAAFSDKNVANGKTVTVSGLSLSGSKAGNYVLAATSVTTTADITAKSITGSFTAGSKTYDATTAAAVLTRTANDVESGDVVSLTGGTATFNTKTVGTGKTVTLSGASLSGADAGNYTLASVGTTTADVTAKSITGSFTAGNKTYDGSTTATVLSRGLTGVVGTDDVSLTGGTATFDNKNVGTGKTVTLSGASLSGADAGNYTLASVGTTTADINAKSITGSFTAGNKTYDGTTTAAVLTRTANSVESGDDVSLTGGTATFENKNVGTGKTVTLSGASLSGADAGNYMLASVGTTTADITAKSITGSFTAGSKAYDATTAATVLTHTANSVESGDVVTLTGGTATFDTKTVGTGKTVTLSGASLSGADVGNYTLASVGTTTADVTAKSITGAFTAGSKTYDATTAAAVSTRTLNDVESGDVVNLTGGTATFDNKNVGTGKTVTLSGASLSGADAGNYTLASVGTTTADINAKSITGSFTAANKTYDTTTTATVLNRSLSGLVSPDDVSLTGGTAAFSSSNAGTWTVTLTGASLSGADMGNYTLSGVAPTTATINPRDASVAYIGSTYFVTSGSSATSTQVTLTASVQDPTGAGLSGATVSFYDLSSGTPKLLAANVKVSPVAGNTSTGIASTTVTLSSGNYGAESYLIEKVVNGNYTNYTQAVSAKTVTLSVVQPVSVGTIKGAGTLSRLVKTNECPGEAVGTYAPTGNSSFSVGVSYNKSLTNLQGQIKLSLPQADGSLIVIKSNSLTSMTAANLSIGKVNTIYAKASIYRVNANGSTTAIEGNVSLRFDVVGTGTSAKVGFTILSGSTLRYSNNWMYDTTAKAWKTNFQDLLTGSGCVNFG